MAWESLGGLGPIFVGVPHQGQVSTAWAMRLLHALGPYLGRVKLFTIQGHPIDVSRGALVELALASKAEYVYFLDSDIYTKEDTLQRLLKHNLPIVSALYYRRHALQVPDSEVPHLPEQIRPIVQDKKRMGMPFFTPAIWKEFDYNDEKGNKLHSFRPLFDGEFVPGQLVEADAVPMGCCLLKTELFRKLPRPWFFWSLNRGPDVLRNDVSSRIELRKGMHGCSEDLYFSLLARKSGYHLMCDTSVVVQHESQVVVDAGGRIGVLES